MSDLGESWRLGAFNKNIWEISPNWWNKLPTVNWDKKPIRTSSNHLQTGLKISYILGWIFIHLNASQTLNDPSNKAKWCSFQADENSSSHKRAAMFPALIVILGMAAPLAHLGKVSTRQKEAGGRGRGAYLEQSSQAMFPEVSLMVRSETNAGYSVSQGSRVCFNFWAVGIREKKKKIKNTRHWLCCDWQPTVTQNAVPLLLLCDFSRHSIMHYFLISQVISSAKQLYKL